MIQTFTKLVGLADERLVTTASANIARLVEKMVKETGKTARRIQEISNSEHNKRKKKQRIARSML